MLARSLLLSAVIAACFQASGQFYPDSNTSWCSTTLGPTNWYSIMYYMGVAPDTSIAGETYKITNEYSGESGAWEYVRSYYVRSGADGKGYAFLLDSMAEYMTGDTTAVSGDTLHNILGWYDGYFGPCGVHWHEFALFDVIVDSVITYSNNGVTVHRQFVTIPCALGMEMPQPYFVFWQAGMGTSFGPLLRVGSPMGQNQVLESSTSAGIAQFVGSTGLPGGTPYCWPVVIAGVPMQEYDKQIITRPNPTPGLITVQFTDPLQAESYYSVYDTMGRLLNQRPWPKGSATEEVDLSRFGSGTYVLKFTSPEGVCTERVVVE